jgi:hypothetical protein
MTTPPVGVERRVGQRFPFLLPVSFLEVSTGLVGLGFTQDLSSRGAFFFTDVPLQEGGAIELTLNMPSEITLGESMRVRCSGRILRVIRRQGQPQGSTPPAGDSDTKIAAAVVLEGYEYLPEPSPSSVTFNRVSALHSQRDDDQAPLEQPAIRPVLG